MNVRFGGRAGASLLVEEDDRQPKIARQRQARLGRCLPGIGGAVLQHGAFHRPPAVECLEITARPRRRASEWVSVRQPHRQYQIARPLAQSRSASALALKRAA